MKKTKAILFPRHGKQYCLRVEYGIEKTNWEYFSITASLGYRSKGQPNDYFENDGIKYRYEAGGCLHDEILKKFPKMVDLVNLHLCTRDGLPSSAAVENGLFYLQEGGLDKVAEYFRLNETDRSRLKSWSDNDGTKDGFIAFVESMKPIWKAEADAVIAKYEL
jgi:hypothetical protein